MKKNKRKEIENQMQKLNGAYFLKFKTLENTQEFIR